MRSLSRTPGVQSATGPPSLVQFVNTQSTGTVRDRFVEDIQICKAGVQKCCSLQIAPKGPVNIRERSGSRTHVVKGTTSPPSLVQFVYTQPTTAIRDRVDEVVHIRTAGIRKCHSLQIVPHSMVTCHLGSISCTPGVQGATGPPSLVQFVYTQPTTAVRRPTSGSNTDSYSRCTKMSFTANCCPRYGKLV